MPLLPRFDQSIFSDAYPPLSSSEINLDISGVAGFFGGDVTLSAMTAVHMSEVRKYLGWYNTPGSYEIARRYGRAARSRMWDSIFPGTNLDPSVLFELEGREGPHYRGIFSGTVMNKSSHAAYQIGRAHV